MISQSKTPVIILNGFLGSGKTTLFRNLLAQARRKNINVCMIVNDMSELDVDGELIASTDFAENTSHNFHTLHSCVLSSKKGIRKLDESVKNLLSYQDPDLIIVETSGSCHPMPLIQYFKKQSDVKLTGVLTLVDSLLLAHDYKYGEGLIPLMRQNLQQGRRDMVNLLVEQIMFCSHLILTKSDRIESDRLKAMAQAIQPINPYVSVISVLFGKLDIDSVLALPEYDYQRIAQLVKELKPILDAEAEGDRPYNMQTRVIRDERPFHPERLWKVCHEYLDQRIYRSKGFFWLASRDRISLLWNQAGGSINLELIGYWRSGIVENDDEELLDMEIVQLKSLIEKTGGRFGDRRCELTVIGDKNQVDRFTDALKSCFLTEEEIEHWESGGTFEDPWPKNIVRLRN